MKIYTGYGSDLTFHLDDKNTIVLLYCDDPTIFVVRKSDLKKLMRTRIDRSKFPEFSRLCYDIARSREVYSGVDAYKVAKRVSKYLPDYISSLITSSR